MLLVELDDVGLGLKGGQRRKFEGVDTGEVRVGGGSERKGGRGKREEGEHDGGFDGHCKTDVRTGRLDKVSKVYIIEWVCVIGRL